MKLILTLSFFLPSSWLFASGKQFRPPAFNICKIKPELPRCAKKEKSEVTPATEMDEPSSKDQEDKK